MIIPPPIQNLPDFVSLDKSINAFQIARMSPLANSLQK